MSSRITLLFLALKTFVFIPQAVITFSIILPFSVPIAISFFFLWISAAWLLSLLHGQINFLSFPVYFFLSITVSSPSFLFSKTKIWKTRLSFPAEKSNCSSYLRWASTGTWNSFLGVVLDMSCTHQITVIKVLALFKRLDWPWAVNIEVQSDSVLC